MTPPDGASRILIIEGETGMASFMTKGLRCEGYRTVAVVDGQTGLEQARTGMFDLVLLGLGLPDMDGTEVLAELRAGGSTVPVVVLTAREFDTEHDVARPSDPDVYLAKPFRFADLLSEVRTQLGPGDSTRDPGTGGREGAAPYPDHYLPLRTTPTGSEQCRNPQPHTPRRP